VVEVPLMTPDELRVSASLTLVLKAVMWEELAL
jgi:hypothetical protein